MTDPRTAPTTIATTIATTGPAPWLAPRKSPVRYAATPTIDPTDRSMLRLMITSPWPTARMATITTVVVIRTND